MPYVKDALIDATERINRAGENPLAHRRTTRLSRVGMVPCPSCKGDWKKAQKCPTCKGRAYVEGMEYYG